MEKETDLYYHLPLGRHMAVLSKIYYGALSKKLEHLELESYYSMLILVDRSENKCTQQCLADASKIDKAQMVRIMDHLVKLGYLTRQQNPDDRREHFITLTAKARKILPDIYSNIDELNEIALNGLTDREKDHFYKTLRTMNQNLSALPATGVILNFKRRKTTK